MEVLAAWAETAFAPRLECLRFACCEDGRAFVAGLPLPAIPGAGFHLLGRLWLPCGYRLPDHAWPELIEELLGLGRNRMAILHPDGRALWQELHGVLNFLGDEGGVPPLGAVLLLLAACRDEWTALCIPFHKKVMEILRAANSDAIPLEIKDTLVRRLKVVNDLPKDLRSSFPAKCLLVSAVFEGGPHSLPREESDKILVELAVHGPRSLQGCSPEMNARARFFRDLRALRIGLARHDSASLEARLRTGLENLSVQPAC